MAITSGIIVWRLQAILYDEARARVDTTMREIVQAAQPQPNPFSIEENASSSITLLFNSNNLAVWQSPTTFVQVDSFNGYPLAKSPNLGGATIAANTALDPAHPAEFRSITLDDRPALVEDRLLQIGGIAVVIHVAQRLDEVNRTFAETRQAIALVLLAAVLAVVGLSILLANQAINPINEFARAMREIGSERLGVRLRWRHRNDEIGDLAESFDDLLARLEEAFARERQFISDASHELKTPLTSINANAQLLLRWGDRDETVRRESLETIEAESATLAGMVSGMLTLAKADRGDTIPKEPTSLAQLASEAVRNAAQRAADKHLALRFDPGATPPIVHADANLLRQLIANLIDNAIKFTERGGIDVRVGCNDTSAWVEIEDTGPGIPEEDLPHVFDRFYRADKARSRAVSGTGLGLAIVRSIARVHGGSVVAEAGATGGALFRATFARLDASLTDLS